MSDPPPSPPTPPAEWAGEVEQARSGDRAAFARLYQRFAPVVHAVLLAHAHRAEADDLTQETFVRVLRGLPGLKDPAAFPAWVLSIARNLAADRGRGVRPPLRLSGEVTQPAPTHEEAPPAAARALSAIRELPEAYRETLMMRLVEGLSGAMIAERTGLTEGSVRVNLSRGMALLRERLADRNGGAP